MERPQPLEASRSIDGIELFFLAFFLFGLAEWFRYASDMRKQGWVLGWLLNLERLQTRVMSETPTQLRAKGWSKIVDKREEQRRKSEKTNKTRNIEISEKGQIENEKWKSRGYHKKKKKKMKRVGENQNCKYLGGVSASSAFWTQARIILE